MLTNQIALENKPYLLLKFPNENQIFTLKNSNVWTIGRNNDNKIVIPNRWISRNHAMIQLVDYQDFYLIDLGSRNGTFVNGRRVNIPVKLKNQDLLTFGQTEIKFVNPIQQKLKQGTLSQCDLEDLEDATSFLHVRRLMSVMVIDIRNFTVLSRKLDDVNLSSLIGTWCNKSGQIIRRYGSWVDKYIGDAVMALWFHGETIVTSQEIFNILRAIYSLNQMTQELNHNYNLPFDLQIGVGINTGHAMVGNTGTGERPDYTAIGDTVNAAFRLESATKTINSDIVIGQETYNYLSQLPNIQGIFREYRLELKGYDNLTLAYGTTFKKLQEQIYNNDNSAFETGPLNKINQQLS